MDRKNAQKDSPAGPWLGLASRAVLGAVLVLSGTLKAAAPAEEFAVVLEAYQLLPPDLIPPLAALLPWVELLAGFSLLAGYRTPAAATAAGAMMAVFILALLSTKLRGIPLRNCGCFGSWWHPSPSTTILVDALLFSLAVLSFYKGRLLYSLDNWADRGYN